MVRFFLLASSILHRLCRPKLGKPGDPARKPPGPHRSCTWLVPPHPSLAGSRRGDEPSARVVAGGFVTLSKETIMIMVVSLLAIGRHHSKQPGPFRQCPG